MDFYPKLVNEAVSPVIAISIYVANACVALFGGLSLGGGSVRNYACHENQFGGDDSYDTWMNRCGQDLVIQRLWYLG